MQLQIFPLLFDYVPFKLNTNIAIMNGKLKDKYLDLDNLNYLKIPLII